VESVGRRVSGGNVGSVSVKSRSARRKRVRRSLALGRGDDGFAQKSGGYGLVERVGVLVVDGGCVHAGSRGRRNSGAAATSRRRAAGGSGAGRSGTATLAAAVGNAGHDAAGARAEAADGRALGGSESGKGAGHDNRALHVGGIDKTSWASGLVWSAWKRMRLVVGGGRGKESGRVWERKERARKLLVFLPVNCLLAKNHLQQWT
jgi:hypothetical protein